MKNIDIIYCNGCSHSAGGGLEIDSLLSDNKTYVRDYYYKKYGVFWKSQTEITYSQRLANILNCRVVNDAASGGGSARSIRMAYEFLKTNWKIRDTIFLILEMPSLSRLDLYSKKLNEYVICNLEYMSNNYSDESYGNLFATRKYKDYPATTNDWESIGPMNVKNYIDNFHSRKNEFLKVQREIDTFFTFLKYNNIKFIFFEGEVNIGVDSHFKQHNLLKMIDGNKIYTDFHQFAVDTKTTIAEETDLLTMDLHPGYFAHIKFAELLDGYIKEKYDTF
jgi:hypothetical protein